MSTRGITRRSPCPVACTLDLIGDRWTLLIVRDLFCGKTHFKDFAASPERVASNILADRLEKLVANGLVERYRSTQALGRDAYRLTRKGNSLFPVLEAVAKWGIGNIRGTEARLHPVRPVAAGAAL